MRDAVAGLAWWTSLLVVMVCASGCVPGITITPRWWPREDPVAVAVAGAIHPGMTYQEVSRAAGVPPFFGGSVSARSDPSVPGADVYHVFWDQAQQHDIEDGTWLYPIASETGAPDRATDRDSLFVDMQDGVVSKVYRGRITSWSM